MHMSGQQTTLADSGLSSMYHIFLGHSSSIVIKRAVWSSFARVLTI